MTRRLPVAVLTLFLLLLPAAALAQTGPNPILLAADSSEDSEGGEEPHEGEGEGGGEGEGEGEHGGELMNMENGDPQDAGAQALAGREASGFVTVMMLVAALLVLVLIAGGLVMGRGKNA